MNITIQEVVKILKGQLILGDPRGRVRRANIDSRSCEPCDLFFALKGDRVDGHDFAMMACRGGAAGVVVSRLDWMKHDRNFNTAIIRVLDPMSSMRHLGEYLRHGFRGPVVGITGSNGKTTTKQMLSSILKTAMGPGLSTKGNYNSQIGLPVVLSELEPDHRWITLEMGASEPGNIAALCEVGHPSIGVITSIGPAHLKTFGSLKRVAESKWELMDSLPQSGCGIVPWGEPLLEPHIRSFSKRLVFFGDDSMCPVRATAIEMGERVSFVLSIAGRTARVNLPVGGRFNVMNALAAAATAWVMECPFDAIVRGLENFEPARMRMEVSTHSSGAIIINDAYNANPVSMIQSIRSLMETYVDRKRVVVIGSMLELGDSSAALHKQLGLELGRTALDHVYLLGPDTEHVRSGALEAGAPESRFVSVLDKRELIRRLEVHMDNETVLLFKGSRGQKLEDVIDGLAPFVVRGR